MKQDVLDIINEYIESVEHNFPRTYDDEVKINILTDLLNDINDTITDNCLGFTPEEIAYMAKFFKEHTSAEYIANDMRILAKLLKAEKKKAHWIPVHEHMWQMFDGEIDITAYCEGYHNGPVCEICGEHPCIHCHPDWETSKCYEESYRCSECNTHKKDRTKFCPDCGAEMELT